VNVLEKAQLAGQIKLASFLTGEFKLRSGMISSFYLDKYRFESDPLIMKAVVDELEKLLPEYFDKLAGLELGGVPLAAALSLKTGKKCLFIRKTPKTYGTCNLVEGGFVTGETAVVIEDVITTAGQVSASVQQMRDLGLIVQHVICVVDRQQGGKKMLEEIDCSLNSVFTLDELKPY
jgi:orotate phosphoribosyltransferase